MKSKKAALWVKRLSFMNEMPAITPEDRKRIMNIGERRSDIDVAMEKYFTSRCVKVGGIWKQMH